MKSELWPALCQPPQPHRWSEAILEGLLDMETVRQSPLTRRPVSLEGRSGSTPLDNNDSKVLK